MIGLERLVRGAEGSLHGRMLLDVLLGYVDFGVYSKTKLKPLERMKFMGICMSIGYHVDVRSVRHHGQPHGRRVVHA